MAMSGETGYAGGTPEVRMEEIVPVCSKVEAGGEGCLQGVKAESRQCHREKQWCAQELARTGSQQGKAMREEGRKVAQQQVKATIFILTTDFSRAFLV